MQFDLIRLVLVSRAQTSLFEQRSESGRALSREEWLREKFSKTIEFPHAKNEFHYIPDIDASKISDLIVGQIGRQFKAVENLPPEEGFKEVERTPWRASSVFIDPRHHADGQKLGFEVKDHIGGSLPIIKSLAKYMNINPDEPYIIEANAIVDPKTFWEFEKANRGRITSITFDLVAPNMFGIRDEMDDELRKFRENEKARNITITLKNPDGLKLNDSRVEVSVNYATEGGGAIIARTKRKGVTFSSNKNAKKETVDIPEEIDRNKITNIVEFVKSSIFGANRE
ncbi:hypothetical protein [Methylocystis sp.]|uniref:hypothetical protein n=1 Tax=Methylocystis sp. TaxID=1911079 RepID=UPI0027356E46|nr:hypothetical protein [Methylocystis sp.]MDP3555606.1 hypothetical protein [Methylocystis sp.]